MITIRLIYVEYTRNLDSVKHTFLFESVSCKHQSVSVNKVSPALLTKEYLILRHPYTLKYPRAGSPTPCK